MGELKQHPVGIAMHDAFDRAMSIVADRIEQFFGPMIEFIRRGYELARDRVMGIVAIDQVRQSWRQRDCVTRRHRVQRGALFGWRKSVPAKLRRRAKRRHGLSFFIHGSATGVHITCSMRSAPVANITSRSNPSAMPEACGIAANADRKSSSTG